MQQDCSVKLTIAGKTSDLTHYRSIQTCPQNYFVASEESKFSENFHKIENHKSYLIYSAFVLFEPRPRHPTVTYLITLEQCIALLCFLELLNNESNEEL